WTQTVSASMNWATAQSHCAGLSLGPNPWRLPVRHELMALLNYAPGATLGLDPAFSAEPATTLVWTGSSLAGSESSTAWLIDVRDGTVQRLGKVSALPRVLCVEK
ncbi:MAG: DUF1566 domain-containing protein, partial [Myxococcota bacterium]|nr:DUF1566 domain-containing protein [Myxococcota bacterium]